MSLVARIVDARDHLRHAVLLLRDLADDDVVLVVAGDRKNEIRRTCDAAALERVDLGRVPELDLVLELRLELLEAILLCSITVISWPMPISARARFAPTFPSARDEDVHRPATGARFTSRTRTASVSTEIAVEVGQTVRSPRVA